MDDAPDSIIVQRPVSGTATVGQIRTFKLVAFMLDIDGFQLPVELWTRAFDSLSLHDLVRASLVSSVWRAMAFAHPTYWRYITVREDPHTEMGGSVVALTTARLTRSTLAPIDVDIGVDTRPGLAGNVYSSAARSIIELLPIVRANVHRCRYIRLHVPDPAMVKSFCAALNETSAPLLQFLDLATSVRSSQLLAKFSLAFSAQLRVLRLNGLAINPVATHLRFSNLEELALVHNAVGPRFSLPAVFMLGPKLRRLAVDGSAFALDFDRLAPTTPALRAGLVRLDSLTLARDACQILLPEFGLHEQLAVIPVMMVDQPRRDVFHAVLAHASNAQSVELVLSGSEQLRRRLMSITAAPSGITRQMTFTSVVWTYVLSETAYSMGAITPLVTTLALLLSDWPELFSRPRRLPALSTLVLLVDAAFTPRPSILQIEEESLEVLILRASGHSYVPCKALAAFMTGAEARLENRRLRLELQGVRLEGSIGGLERFFYNGLPGL